MTKDPNDTLIDLTNQLISQIQLEHIITDQPLPALHRRIKSISTATSDSSTTSNKISLPAPYHTSEKSIALEELRRTAIVCTGCKLAPTRTQVVYGVGNPDADLVFVGEAPGRDEDEQGFPFVGRAGQLLTDMIEHPRSLGIKRRDVYICNVIKCRPPNNRNPEPDEIDSCEPYLIKQLEIIQPKVICALGKFAAQNLLRTETPISKLRGNWYEYHRIFLMPTYHPAALLRNPGWKKNVWTDLLQIKDKLASLR